MRINFRIIYSTFLKGQVLIVKKRKNYTFFSQWLEPKIQILYRKITVLTIDTGDLLLTYDCEKSFSP